MNDSPCDTFYIKFKSLQNSTMYLLWLHQILMLGRFKNMNENEKHLVAGGQATGPDPAVPDFSSTCNAFSLQKKKKKIRRKWQNIKSC